MKMYETRYERKSVKKNERERGDKKKSAKSRRNIICVKDESTKREELDLRLSLSFFIPRVESVEWMEPRELELKRRRNRGDEEMGTKGTGK